MAAAFTTSDILSATGGTLVHQGAWDTFCGVSTDSRTTQAGGLFIPLTGEKHDGHEFIPAALRRGARGVLVEQRILKATGVGAGFKPAPTALGRNFPPEITVIAIPDALTALGDLARAWRARFGVPVVGITGSCGKTTTKEMIAATLAPAFRVLKNRLNLNNLIGMPLTLLELERTHEAAVVEMGMNAFGEINRLTRISCPTIGVLTNVHPAHTEGVGDIAGVARAKGELIRALDHGAALIYNADDPWVARLAQDFRGPKLSFGLNAAARLRAQEAEAVLVGDHHAGDQVHALGRRIGAAAVLQQLAIAEHRRQPLFQRVEAIRRGQRQLLRQRIGVHRAVVRGQHLQDHLAAGDGLRVALRLARGVRIAFAPGARGHRRLGGWRPGGRFGRPAAARAAEGPHQACIRQPAGRLAGGFLRAVMALRSTRGSGRAGLAGGLAAAAWAALAGGFGHVAMVQRARIRAVCKIAPIR